MKRRIFGLETEYGLICTLHGQRRLSPDNTARYIFEKVIPCARNANLFLKNGGRLYLDTGFHPEYATPECDDIYTLIAHEKAGERIMENLIRIAEKKLMEDGIFGNIILFKNNTDFVGNSYGSHENFLISRTLNFQKISDFLIPFLVTRQIFAGSGKILQTSKGISYNISQRAQHICQEVSGATTSSRSIINTRDEPHADAEKYRRLHVIVGDSNMSEYASYLKVATTALIIDICEDNFIVKDFTFQSPVQAVREISQDLTCRAKVKLKDGKVATAIEIQKEYLNIAYDYYQRKDKNPVVEDILEKWSFVLEKLEEDPMQLNREIDWVIKKSIIENYIAKFRIDPKDSKILMIDLQYHDIRYDRGLFNILERHNLVEKIIAEDDIEKAINEPPQTTRAKLRGEFIKRADERHKDYRVDWVYLKLNDPEQETIICKDPFVSIDDRVEKLICSM